jgi:O-antigen/teichoic acid export membrane protein
VTYGIAKALPGLLGLFSVVVFLRLTGESAYGRFALISAIVNVWILFSGGWFYQSILRFGGSWRANPDAAHRLLINGLTIACASFLVVGFLHLRIADGISTTTVFALLLGILSIIQATQLAELQAHLLARRILVAEMLRSGSCFAFACLLAISMTDGTSALLLGTVLGYAMSVVHIQHFLPATGTAPSQRVEIPRVSQLWSFGWPLSGWLAGQLALPLIDRSMMAGPFGLAETGKFAALSDILTRCFSLAIFPITQAVYPRMIQMIDSGRSDAATGLLRRAGLLLLLLGAAVLPGLYFFRDFIVRFSLPNYDSHYASLVLPLAAGGLVWQGGLLLHKPLEMAGRTRAMLGAMIFALAIKAFANLWLLPSLGTRGAAYATLLAGLSYSLTCAVLNWQSKR